MDERGVGRERRPRSRWVRRAVLLGSVGAGLWLAGSLGHPAAAHAAVINPPCCLARAAAPLATVRTVVQQPVSTVLNPTNPAPTDQPDPGTLRHIVPPVRTLPVRTLPVPALDTPPLLARHAAAGRTVPSADHRIGPRTPARASTAPIQPTSEPIRCAVCRPGNPGTDHRPAQLPTPLPAPPGTVPPDTGNTGSTVAGMALLAPANGNSGSPPGLPIDPTPRTSAPRSRTVTPTSRPG